ncbi:MAG: aminotransferase class I/II-fold pyridoxal phosphate-dependent enzyme [Cyanobacteria bacterium P01_F01_bin.42]
MISTVDHSRTPLLSQVAQQANCPHQRFYMPGHKGGSGSSSQLINSLGISSLRADMPELPVLDQLFAPSGVIQEAQALAADAFGAEQTYFLVNGTSVGLIAAIMTLCGPGDRIIVPRNCHQSIIHGLILSGAEPVWICPKLAPDLYLPYVISPAALKTALLTFLDVKAAIAISPTYEGICGDIKGLAAIAHQHNIPLIVDEAHGAHLCFHPDLPPSALSQGADLVVQSTHKTLGACTQASMLHIQGDRIDLSRLQATLTLLQSSSPSYLLLASLDAARHQMATQGAQILDTAMELAAELREQLKALSAIQVLDILESPDPGFTAIDPLKLTLDLTRCSLSGFELDEILSQEYQIWAELPAETALTFMLGQGNTSVELEQLNQALTEQDHPKIESSCNTTIVKLPHAPFAAAMTPRNAFNATSEPMLLTHAQGRLSAKIICPYPPGIPLIFPGEEITGEAIAALAQIHQAGGTIIGLIDDTIDCLT